jgi:hypothetical protein
MGAPKQGSLRVKKKGGAALLVEMELLKGGRK